MGGEVGRPTLLSSFSFSVRSWKDDEENNYMSAQVFLNFFIFVYLWLDFSQFFPKK